MTPRVFARVVGGLMILGALIALAFVPVSIADRGDSVRCGFALSGVTDDAMYRDASHAISAAMNPQLAEPTPAVTTLAQQCADAVSTRRAWGWPIAGLGLVAFAASFVSTAPSARRAAGGP